jgi:hypothetical protein
MRIVRAILIALMALSVTMPPLAMAKAHVPSPDGVVAAAQSDCCPKMNHCDKQVQGDCAKLAGCALKCASPSAVNLTPSGIALRPSAAPQASALAGIATTRASTPPSPPPRA